MKRLGSIMRSKLLMVASLALAVSGVGLVGCKKKAAQNSRLDPHSSEGLMQQVVVQGNMLREGVKAKEFAYVDNRAHYLQGVVKALYSSLDAEKKQRLESLFNEVIKVAEELDHAAGRRHEGATVASMEKLDGLLKELQAQLGAASK